MPPVLAPEDDLPPMVYALARKVARRMSRGSARLHPTMEREDIEQQALIAALLYLRKTERDDSDDGFSMAILGRAIEFRVIDWMRTENPLGDGRGRPHLPLDDLLVNYLPDESDPYQEVEDVATVQSLIQSYSGPPWHIEVALLLANGCTLQEVGSLYGVTESRISHVQANVSRRLRRQVEEAGEVAA